MMIQLKKCLGYLKSLKLLFTFLGISCFILLGNSSVNAGAIYQVGTYSYLSPYDSTIRLSVLNKGGFISNRIGTSKRVFAPISKTSNNSNDGEYMYMWWYNGLPYFYANYWFNLDTSNAYDNLYQGQPTTYYVCPGVLTGDSGDSFDMSFSQCSGVPVGVGTPNALKSFLNTVNSNDMFYIDYRSFYNYGYSYQLLDFCVSSIELGDTVCFRGGCSPRETNSACTELTNSLGLYRHMQFEEISDYIISDSPAVDNNMGSDNDYSGGLVDDTDAIYVYHGSGYRTNEDMMNAYLANGYYTGLCYGNFSLDNIFEGGDISNCGAGVNRSYCVFASVFENQDCEDGQSYCGANIFELATQRNYTGYVNHPALWFQNLMGAFTTSWKYGVQGDFVGKSKGLVYLSYKLYNDIENGFLNANGDDYMHFCDMVINGYDPNEYYNGKTSEYVDEYFGSSDINIILSGANEDFTGASDFFSLFNKFYSNAKNTFKIDNTGATGILPTYIIFGFLLFVLLYGLKR